MSQSSLGYVKKFVPELDTIVVPPNSWLNIIHFVQSLGASIYKIFEAQGLSAFPQLNCTIKDKNHHHIILAAD